ncbi:MAG: hypothetical protein JWN72_2378, partial [Thermoleophilia bacterium]|nr:hypothetical protein [Thermoleophilia bacterium]
MSRVGRVQRCWGAVLALLACMAVAPGAAGAAAPPASVTVVVAAQPSVDGTFASTATWTAPPATDPTRLTYDVQVTSDGVAGAPTLGVTGTSFAFAARAGATVSVSVATH